MNSKQCEVMPFEEKNRQEKEAYAQRIMAEMKLKNEKLKERHREVQKDRERAEERNSSITTGRNAKKEANKDIAPKVKLEREWDRGKPNPDSVDWDSTKHHDYYSRNTKGNSDRRIRKDDSWRSRSTFTSNKPASSFYTKYHSKKNETIPESSMYRNYTNHFNSSSRFNYPSNIDKSHATNESSHHSYQSSKLDDNPKKVSNISLNYSEPKKKPGQHSMQDGMDELMWQCGSKNEAQHKLIRIENWVKSINMNHGFTDTTDALSMPEEYKRQGKRKDLSSRRERFQKYGFGDDSSNRKAKEQTHFRIKEKSEHKCNQYFSNSRGHGNKISSVDRCSSISDSKNQREGKRRNLNERPRLKCESDLSDHASSMKESDDLDWEKDKIIRARSISESSENSCRRGREKRVHICEEPNLEYSGSHGSENLKIESLKRDVTWNEEKDEETINKESKYFRQNCPQGKDKNKYGSKSLPLQYSSVNYEYKGHIYQNPYRKKSNNHVKNKFHKNKSGSNSSFNSEKESFDCGKYSQKLNTTSHQNGDTDAEIQIVNEKRCDNSKSETIQGKFEKSTFLSVTNTDKILQSSDSSDYQIVGTWDECNDSKNSGVDYEPTFENMSKSEIISFSCAETAGCSKFDYLSSKKSENKKMVCKDSDPECQIIESTTLVNSFPQDLNCDDIYKKNVESAENIIIALKSKQKETCASHNQKIKVKRYSHKHKFVKTEKPSQKPKLSVDTKVTDKSLGNEVKSNYLGKDSDVIYLYTDTSISDYDGNVSSPDKNLDDHVKPVLGRKQMLTENTKRSDDGDANIGALNLSDNEWSTITDNEDSVSDDNLSISELK